MRTYTLALRGHGKQGKPITWTLVGVPQDIVDEFGSAAKALIEGLALFIDNDLPLEGATILKHADAGGVEKWLTDERDQLRAELEQLREFSRHKSGCDSLNHSLYSCNCGYAALEKRDG